MTGAVPTHSTPEATTNAPSGVITLGTAIFYSVEEMAVRMMQNSHTDYDQGSTTRLPSA